MNARRAEVVALVNRGHMALAADDLRAALEAYEDALEIDPFELQAHLGLALGYQRLGDYDASERHRRDAIKLAPVRTIPYRGTGQPIRVLALLATANANIDLEPLLPNELCAITLAHVDAMPAGAELPRHDILFNAIGDADAAERALTIANVIVSRSDAPLVNHPTAVANTRRDRNAARLRALPSLRVPRIARIARERLHAGQARLSLAAAGISYPFLLRSPGFHNGRFLSLVEDPTKLGAALGTLPGEELYAIEYIDTRDKRGYYCKYRVLFIGDQIVPVHAALSTTWKVHYEVADLASSELGRALDRDFRRYPRARIGERAYAALEAVRSELGLQYAGVDFGLDDEGNPVLFEANATMLPGKASERARKATLALIRGLLAPSAG